MAYLEIGEQYWSDRNDPKRANLIIKKKKKLKWGNTNKVQTNNVRIKELPYCKTNVLIIIFDRFYHGESVRALSQSPDLSGNLVG